MKQLFDVKEILKNKEYEIKEIVMKDVANSLAGAYMEKYGDEVLKEIRAEMIKHWGDLFRSKVLGSAMKKVMEENYNSNY